MLETRAAAIKAMATWHATHTVQECREACGGLGYLSVNRFAALKADSDVFTTFEGDNLVLRQLVAKNLLTDFRDELGELDPLGTVAFYAGQIFEVIAERTAARELVGRARRRPAAVPRRRARPARPRAPAAAVPAGARTTCAARRRAAAEGRHRRRRRPVPRAHRHAGPRRRRRPRAHGEDRARGLRRARSSAARGRDVKEVLDQLCSLYALCARRARPRLVPGARQALLDRVQGGHQGGQHTCASELRPDAAALVEAFGVPDEPAPAPSKRTGCSRTMSA